MTRESPVVRWVVVVGLAVGAVVAIVAAVEWPGRGVAPVRVAAAVRPEVPVVAAGPVVVAPAVAAPSFDVVRVAPDGSAVLAGRAAPGADVVVGSDAGEVGRARADGRGTWVLVPERPVAPGAGRLTVIARGADGRETPGAAPVVLAKRGDGVALAAVVPPTGPVRVLQGGSATPGRLALGSVDYDDRGAIQFGGSAPPRAPLRVYVDNKPVGEVRADGSGAWTLTPRVGVAAGVHRLRVDQLTAAGGVAVRVQMPFQRSVVATGAMLAGRVVVQPGESLWRIARASYGRGIRYTVIFAANHDQIRNPARIWPGQVFAVPGI